MRVHLAHDWLTGMRGGEKVLELLCQGFPGAPIFTLIHHPPAISPTINEHSITTTWLQRVPGIEKTYRNFLPLFPLAIRGWNPPPADMVISTSHCIAKGIRPPRGARHLCYCFTPMRYAWTFYHEYFGGHPLKGIAIKPTLALLRGWDLRASDRVDMFVAISRHVQGRILEFYGRESEVVYPPVDTEFFTPGEPGEDDFDLIVSALVPYKRIDLAVRAYNRLGRRLKIVGTGTDFARLQREAGPNLEFLGWRSNQEIRDLYRRCRCLIFPGEEDFGIVPVEAQACGKPVVAFRKGGALETVAAGVSGEFFDHPTEDSLLAAIESCAARSWDAARIRRHAEQFSVQRFLDGLDKAITLCLQTVP